MLEHTAVPDIVFDDKHLKGMMVFHICVGIGYVFNVEQANLFPILDNFHQLAFHFPK
jgi:hypothetical protein